jgi:hypothetical protein
MKYFLLATIAFLLTSNAHAADSWVLWEGTMTMGSNQPYEWKIIAAFPTHKQCMDRHKEDFAIIQKINKTTLLSPETIEIRNSLAVSAKGNELVTQKCLPENIDPRSIGEYGVTH